MAKKLKVIMEVEVPDVLFCYEDAETALSRMELLVFAYNIQTGETRTLRPEIKELLGDED